jgi:hypothetical protein
MEGAAKVFGLLAREWFDFLNSSTSRTPSYTSFVIQYGRWRTVLIPHAWYVVKSHRQVVLLMLNASLAPVDEPIRKISMPQAKLLYSQVLSSSLPLKSPGTSQQRALSRPGPTFFWRQPRTKTEKQKEKARKFQRTKRRRKRAGMKSASDSSQNQQAARMVESGPQNYTTYSDGFSSYDLSPWYSSSYEKIDFFRTTDWYWSAGGGWLRHLVLLDDGVSREAFYWSHGGGYLNINIPHPDFLSTSR